MFYLDKESIGSRVVVFGNYIYDGILLEVQLDYIVLDDCHIVYETGPFSEKYWKDAQTLPIQPWRVSRHSIESGAIYAPKSKSRCKPAT